MITTGSQKSELASPSAILLRTAFAGNAVFSGLCAVGIGYYAPYLSQHLPLKPNVLYILAVGLFLFAAYLVWVIQKTDRSIREAKFIIFGDLTWVCASLFVLVLPLKFSDYGTTLNLLTAGIVGAFAIFQILALPIKESTFTCSRLIEESIAQVWERLADLGNIADWHPGLEKSFVVSDGKIRVGSRRMCELPGGYFLEEEVVEWQRPTKLSLIIRDTDLPFKFARIEFNLIDKENATLVQVTPCYKLKYGVFGVLLDVVSVRKTYQQGMEQLLKGLAQSF